jgi:hypothetical protein
LVRVVSVVAPQPGTVLAAAKLSAETILARQRTRPIGVLAVPRLRPVLLV